MMHEILSDPGSWKVQKDDLGKWLKHHNGHNLSILLVTPDGGRNWQVDYITRVGRVNPDNYRNATSGELIGMRSGMIRFMRELKELVSLEPATAWEDTLTWIRVAWLVIESRHLGMGRWSTRILIDRDRYCKGWQNVHVGESGLTAISLHVKVALTDHYLANIDAWVKQNPAFSKDWYEKAMLQFKDAITEKNAEMLEKGRAIEKISRIQPSADPQPLPVPTVAPAAAPNATCARCGNGFEAKTMHATFCSTRCRVAAHRAKAGTGRIRTPEGNEAVTEVAKPIDPWAIGNPEGKPVLLDLFCGSGGCGKGYMDAGFHVIGIDKVPQPDYPGVFIQADWLEGLDRLAHKVDLIHASPPCQRYSTATASTGTPSSHPDLLPIVRDRLVLTGLPWIIENVPQAPMRADLKLCGLMFGMRVIRWRHFELNLLKVSQPAVPEKVGTAKDGDYVTVAGNGHSHNCNRKKDSKPFKFWLGNVKDTWRKEMLMPWATTVKGLANAIPPPYTEYIGRQVLAQVVQQEVKSFVSKPVKYPRYPKEAIL